MFRWIRQADLDAAAAGLGRWVGGARAGTAAARRSRRALLRPAARRLRPPRLRLGHQSEPLERPGRAFHVPIGRLAAVAARLPNAVPSARPLGWKRCWFRFEIPQNWPRNVLNFFCFLADFLFVLLFHVFNVCFAFHFTRLDR